VRFQKSLMKTMLTAFFYSSRICVEKQTVYSKFYKEAIKILIARVHRVRLQFQESGSWSLLHDNELVHSSGVVSEFLAK
jgi:hypothetical protein